MSAIVYIGVDDTDVLGGVGTGRVARGLAQRLAELGLGVPLGVSRHQLLVDERIKYTSHNSAKGIAFRCERPAADLIAPSVEYMVSCFQPGSDPGLCICSERQVGHGIIEFGKKALSTLLSKQQALDLAAQNGVFLRELGGSGEGVIGALAAVGLRAWGNEGRLVDLPGIHEIKGLITVGDLLARTAVSSVVDVSGRPLGRDETIDSLGWIRPSLAGGQPVLRVEPTADAQGRRIWVMIDRKHNESRGGE